ncbi:PRC-barrel domain-containing protein [Muricoccus radiodurans]|uniref:PRC-barrel domain-containing protein n=1 Tax=Muricoccus radiodurans TaxID=2231721 RepID=UPI003CE8BD86
MRRILTTTALALLLAGPAALAQTAVPGLGEMRAKELMDRDVYGTDGRIGEVEDLILDFAGARVVAVVIEVDRGLGRADRYVTVPPDRLTRAAGERRLSLGMTVAEARAMPGVNDRD